MLSSNLLVKIMCQVQMLLYLLLCIELSIGYLNLLHFSTNQRKFLLSHCYWNKLRCRYWVREVARRGNWEFGLRITSLALLVEILGRIMIDLLFCNWSNLGHLRPFSCRLGWHHPLGLTVYHLCQKYCTTDFESIVFFVLTDQKLFPAFRNLKGNMRICSCYPFIPKIISEANNCKSINNFLLEKINNSS